MKNRYHEQGERARRKKREKLETKADIQGQKEVHRTEWNQRLENKQVRITHLYTRLPPNNLNVPLI